MSWQDDAAQVLFSMVGVGVEAEGSGRTMRVFARIAIQSTHGFCLRASDSHLRDLDHRLTLIVLILVVLTDHWLDHSLIVLNPQAQSVIPMCCHKIHKYNFIKFIY